MARLRRTASRSAPAVPTGRRPGRRRSGSPGSSRGTEHRGTVSGRRRCCTAVLAAPPVISCPVPVRPVTERHRAPATLGRSGAEGESACAVRVTGRGGKRWGHRASPSAPPESGDLARWFLPLSCSFEDMRSTSRNAVLGPVLALLAALLVAAGLLAPGARAADGLGGAAEALRSGPVYVDPRASGGSPAPRPRHWPTPSRTPTSPSSSPSCRRPRSSTPTACSGICGPGSVSAASTRSPSATASTRAPTAGSCPRTPWGT